MVLHTVYEAVVGSSSINGGRLPDVAFDLSRERLFVGGSEASTRAEDG